MKSSKFAGYPANNPNPSGAGVLSIAPINKLEFLQNRNRANGDSQKDVRGAYLYVEQCDLPCTIALTVDNVAQSFPAVAGMEIIGNFDGLAIYHGDYSSSSSALGVFPKLVISVSQSYAKFNHNWRPSFQSPLPWRVALDTPGQYAAEFPLFPGSRFISIHGQYMRALPTPDNGLYAEILFYEAGSVLPLWPVFAYPSPSGVLYDQPASYRKFWYDNSCGEGINEGAFDFDLVPVPTPSQNFGFCRVYLTFCAIDSDITSGKFYSELFG